MNEREKAGSVGARTNISSATDNTGGVPGRTTSALEAYANTIAGVGNGGGVCVKHGGDGCFLDNDQRGALKLQVIRAIVQAQIGYVSALKSVEMAKLVEHEEELSPLVGIVIAFVAGSLVGELQCALKALSGKGGAAVRVVESVDEGQLDSFIEASADKAKELTLARLQKTLTEKQQSDKAASLGYLEVLEAGSEETFKHVAKDSIGYATDAQLTVLFEAFDGASADLYKTRIEGQLKRYLDSHARDIGRTATGRPINKLVETRVAWLIRRDGSRQLIYMKREFKDKGPYTSAQTIPSAYNSEHALSLSDDATWNFGPYDNERRHEPALGDDEMLGFVEPELQQLALRRHEATWQAEPETFTYDYSVMPPKLVKVERGGAPAAR